MCTADRGVCSPEVLETCYLLAKSPFDPSAQSVNLEFLGREPWRRAINSDWAGPNSRVARVTVEAT